MRRPIDSLFGRLVVLVIGMLVLSHVAWFAIIRFERDNVQTRYAVEEAAFLVEAVRQHIANSPDQPLPPRVRVVPLDESRRAQAARRRRHAAAAAAFRRRPERPSARRHRRAPGEPGGAAERVGARREGRGLDRRAGAAAAPAAFARPHAGVARDHFLDRRAWPRCSPRGSCSSRCARSRRRSGASAAASRRRPCPSAARASCGN